MQRTPHSEPQKRDDPGMPDPDIHTAVSFPIYCSETRARFGYVSNEVLLSNEKMVRFKFVFIIIYINENQVTTH